MAVTVFQINDAAEPFLAYVKAQALQGSIAEVVAGSYDIATIPSFVMDEADYKAFVVGSEFEAKDKSRLTITSCNKAYSHLVMPDGQTHALGSAHQITEYETFTEKGWLHRPDMNAYWTFRKGNPDKVDHTQEQFAQMAA